MRPASEILRSLNDSLNAFVSKPSTLVDFLHIAASAVFVGTAYCALWCRISYFPMHDGRMPLWLSFWWSTTNLLPWLVAFEAAKRIAANDRGARGARTIALLILTAATALVTMSAKRIGDQLMMGMAHDAWGTMIASQMQPIVLFALALIVFAQRQSAQSTSAEPLADGLQQPNAFLPPASTIDWIRAAGNYVEMKCEQRVLIRRMTMRQAERLTRSEGFVRVHRSIIVRERLIDSFDGARIRLISGDVFPVGDSYRPVLRSLVTPSQISAPRHASL